MEINNTRTINELVSAIAYVLDVMNEDLNLYHSWRVGIFASEFAKKILPEERKNIFYASLLHDIGYLALPNHIMHYLSIEEVPEKDPVIASHPIIGAEITSQIPNLSTAAKYVLNHHEWFNGSGYPDRLMGDEIPKLARILHCADAFEAMTGKRPYKRRLSIHEAIEELKENSGTQFDPRIVEAFIRCTRHKKFRNYS